MPFSTHTFEFLAWDRRIPLSHVRGGECKLTTALYVHGASVGIEPEHIECRKHAPSPSCPPTIARCPIATLGAMAR